jgi:hypothetical protein
MAMEADQDRPKQLRQPSALHRICPGGGRRLRLARLTSPNNLSRSAVARGEDRVRERSV